MLRAYYDLATTRNQDGVIPINRIWEYADRYDLGDLFISQIQLIDAGFLKEARDGDNKKKSN